MSGLGAPTKFEDEFKRIALPQLEDEIRRHAFQIGIARSFEDDDGAWAQHEEEINYTASRMGSGRLPPRIQTDLVDWIGRTLLEEVDLAEKRVERLRSQNTIAERDRGAEFWKWVVEHTSTRNRRAIEHIAVALSPQYRAGWMFRQDQKHPDRAQVHQRHRNMAIAQGLRP